MNDLERRVSALECAVARLESPGQLEPQGQQRSSAEPQGQQSSSAEPLWLLSEVRQRHPQGAVVFGGTARIAAGEVAWQWGTEAEPLLQAEWDAAAPVLDALSHPVRLWLLQSVLNGTTTTAELAADEALGTTGQLHHHLRALVAAGWLQSTGRGRWSVAPHRVIPLLVTVVAATGK